MIKQKINLFMPRFLFVAHAMARLEEEAKEEGGGEGGVEEEAFAMKHTYHYNHQRCRYPLCNAVKV